ncbi:hypothetical protein [Escherichia albertii]|uniref:hypothetical protein n=1 Tax=Escherichia albertii TaxID=208962 RepID=UPI00201634F1|nr:hypothetical protein [Escherichia albertii]
MEELHFVYINANGRIGVHSIQSISYSENHIQGICKNTDRIKTFRKDRILKQYDSPEQAIQECASFLPESYSHLTKQSGPKKNTFDVCFTGFKNVVVNKNCHDFRFFPVSISLFVRR